MSLLSLEIRKKTFSVEWIKLEGDKFYLAQMIREQISNYILLDKYFKTEGCRHYETTNQSIG